MNKLDHIKIPSNFDCAIDEAIDKAFSEKKRIKSRKRKSIAAGLSTALIVGTIAINSETTWAYIENITKHIESFLGREDSIFDKYKFEGLQTVEDNGLKFSLGELMIDDVQILVSMSMDYTNFKPKDKNIDASKIHPSLPTVTIDNIPLLAPSGGVVESEKVEGENKVNILLKINFWDLNTDINNTDKNSYEILDNIESGKEYNLKMTISNLYYNDKEEYNLGSGKWEFNTKINASNIIKDTNVHKVNKKIKIDEDVYKGDLDIEEIRISPLSVKVKYNYDLYTDISVNKRREPRFIVKNQNGKELELGSGAGGQLNNGKWYIGDEFNLKGNEKKIIITPCVYINDKAKLFTEDAIVLDID